MTARGFSVLPLLVLALAVVLAACGKSDRDQTGGQRYHCPMHPTYISDKPGDCPICGMTLVPIKDDQAPAESSPKPAAGGDKIEQVEPGHEPQASHGAHAPGAQAPRSVPGRTAITLSPDKRQLIGLTLSKVEKHDLARTVRTAARVEHDETRYAKIAPRFAGWVRELHVDFTGAPVEKDQPLFTVYSPEIYSAENEYLVAARAVKQLQADAPPSQKESTGALLQSAHLRLELFEIGDAEIKELEERGSASAALLFRAPFSGHVIVKNAIAGKAFMAGESLYEIADLSHLWLRAYVFEFEMPLIAVGQDAVLNFPYLGNQSFPAQVTFIYPHIEPQTRRGEIRLELDNPEHQIRPDMWANVEITVATGEKLTVPASSLIDTGPRYVAFAEGPEQRLEPREVTVGMKTDDYYEVISGLREGEQVVTRALFLVDSESQLKAAISGMGEAGAHQH